MMLDFAHDKSTCKACAKLKYRENAQKFREYHKDYVYTRRWLDGGTDNFLIGDK